MEIIYCGFNDTEIRACLNFDGTFSTYLYRDGEVVRTAETRRVADTVQLVDEWTDELYDGSTFVYVDKSEGMLMDEISRAV